MYETLKEKSDFILHLIFFSTDPSYFPVSYSNDTSTIASNTRKPLNFKPTPQCGKSQNVSHKGRTLCLVNIDMLTEWVGLNLCAAQQLFLNGMDLCGMCLSHINFQHKNLNFFKISHYTVVTHC